ncbi:hypothetical protein NADFUDRAFT_45724 [Nadsonia fulvescens var. elongata DSM 6958]|uniref:HTH araC/xylS-type domain-containing protein n=1 Tax=Nadsonia fulvescens var. elongata DSM 6958 TaxID=857566 RepID=A0A1E3PQG5_9ASCO|nr:hypothetical protein NADFUDRAFT_45724 [Nadsonia fulvescens var. elongata DSM 6958]
MISLVDYTVLAVNRSIDLPSPTPFLDGAAENGPMHNTGNASGYSSGSELSPSFPTIEDLSSSSTSAMGSAMKLNLRSHSHRRNNQSLPENLIDFSPRPRASSISTLHVEGSNNSNTSDNDNEINGDHSIPCVFTKFSQRRASIANGHIPSACLGSSHPTSNVVTDKSKSNGDHVRLIMNSCRHIAEATVQTINGDAIVKDFKDPKSHNRSSASLSAEGVSSFNGVNAEDSLAAKSKRRRGGIIGFKELASKAGLSAWHFHRVFKSVTGITPKAYGDKCFEVAKQALEDNTLSADFVDIPFPTKTKDVNANPIKQEEDVNFGVAFNYHGQGSQQQQDEVTARLNSVSPSHFDTDVNNSVMPPELPVFQFESFMMPSPNSLSSGTSTSVTALADSFSVGQKSVVPMSDDIISPISMAEDPSMVKLLPPLLENSVASFMEPSFTTESQLFDINNTQQHNLNDMNFSPAHVSPVHASLFSSLTNMEGDNSGVDADDNSVIDNPPVDESIYSVTSSAGPLPSYINGQVDASSSLLGSYPSFTSLSIEPISQMSHEISDFEYINVNMNSLGAFGNAESSDDIFAELTNLNGFQDSTNNYSVSTPSAKLCEPGLMSNVATLASVGPSNVFSPTVAASSPLFLATGSCSSSSLSISTPSPLQTLDFPSRDPQVEKSTFKNGSDIFVYNADAIVNASNSGIGNNAVFNTPEVDASGNSGSPVIVSGLYDSNQYLQQPVAVPY